MSKLPRKASLAHQYLYNVPAPPPTTSLLHPYLTLTISSVPLTTPSHLSIPSPSIRPTPSNPSTATCRQHAWIPPLHAPDVRQPKISAGPALGSTSERQGGDTRPAFEKRLMSVRRIEKDPGAVRKRGMAGREGNAEEVRGSWC